MQDYRIRAGLAGYRISGLRQDYRIVCHSELVSEFIDPETSSG